MVHPDLSTWRLLGLFLPTLCFSKWVMFGLLGFGKPNLVTYRGPTMLATTLHAMAILLKISQWDWFINLSASDYPLVTQDDLIHVFSDMPRDLNFVQHTSRLGWKLNKRGKPMIIDPALYSLNKSEIWWVIKQRTLPTAFKLYTGFDWTVLSRSFAENCVVGWENLPRTLLYTTQTSSPRLKGISKRSYATPKATRARQLTTTSTSSPGTSLQSSTRGLSVPRTTGKWSRATAPSPGSSSRTTEPLTGLTANS